MAPMRPHSPRPSPAQSQLLDAIGGPKKVAELVNDRLKLEGDDALLPQAVSMWKVRGIPYRYRAILAIEARERSIGVPAGFLGETVAE